MKTERTKGHGEDPSLGLRVLYGSNLKPFSSGFIAPLRHLGKASVLQSRLKVRSDISDVTVDGAEARESDPPLPPQVALGPLVNPLD